MRNSRESDSRIASQPEIPRSSEGTSEGEKNAFIYLFLFFCGGSLSSGVSRARVFLAARRIGGKQEFGGGWKGGCSFERGTSRTKTRTAWFGRCPLFVEGR